MFARQDIPKLVGTAVAVAALSVATPASAAAYTATDEAFLKKTFADGVDFAQPEQTIKRAHVACDAFGAGMSPGSVHAKIQNDSVFTPRQTAIFMADAVQAYCPGYADLFVSQVE